MAFWEVEMRFFTEDGNNDPERFEVFLDAVVDALAEQGFDVDYTAVASQLEAGFTIEVQDESEAGLIKALEALQAALSTVTGGVIETEHLVKSTRNLALA